MAGARTRLVGPAFHPTCFRRSPHLVCYWKDGDFLLHNYATGRIASATPLVCDVLNFFHDWRPAGGLWTALPGANHSVLDRLVRELEHSSFLQRADRQENPAERAMATFSRWNPSAGFFHTTTKDVRFISARVS